MVLERQMEEGRRAKPATAEVGWWPFTVDMILKSGKNTHCHSNSSGTLLVVEMGKDVGDWSLFLSMWLSSCLCIMFFLHFTKSSWHYCQNCSCWYFISEFYVLEALCLVLTPAPHCLVTIALGHIWKLSVKPLTLLLTIILSILNSLHFRVSFMTRVSV